MELVTDGTGLVDEIEEGVDAGAAEESADVALDGVLADAEVVGDVGIATDALDRERGDFRLAWSHAAVLLQPHEVGNGLPSAGAIGQREALTEELPFSTRRTLAWQTRAIAWGGFGLIGRSVERAGEAAQSSRWLGNLGLTR